MLRYRSEKEHNVLIHTDLHVTWLFFYYCVRVLLLKIATIITVILVHKTTAKL